MLSKTKNLNSNFYPMKKLCLTKAVQYLNLTTVSSKVIKSIFLIEDTVSKITLKDKIDYD